MMNEHELLLQLANALISICSFECCDYGFEREIELAEKILDDERTCNYGNNQNNGDDN